MWQPGTSRPTASTAPPSAADDDLQFPGPALLARSAELFGNLKQTHLLKDCKHCPPFTDAFTGPWIARVEAFLAAEVRPLVEKAS